MAKKSFAKFLQDTACQFHISIVPAILTKFAQFSEMGLIITNRNVPLNAPYSYVTTIITPNVFSCVDDIPAVSAMRKPDRTRCMSILHRLNGKIE